MRIRSIKPEYWRSEDITALTWHDRLLFIGLWSYVDDNGVGLDKLHAIAADLFAGDLLRDSSETFARVSKGLNSLSEQGLIDRYSVDGKDYLYIRTWEDHQRIVNPNKPRHPLPTCDNAVPRAGLVSVSRGSSETLSTGAVEQGSSGSKNSPAPAPPRAAPPKKLDHTSDPDFLAFWKIYPRKDDKADAYKAWKAARRLASVEEIISGAQRYADDPGREGQYTKMPATWLRAGSWENGLLPRDVGASRPESAEDRRVREARERRLAREAS